MTPEIKTINFGGINWVVTLLSVGGLSGHHDVCEDLPNGPTMICQTGSHCRSARFPAAYTVIDLQGQGFDRARHVVNGVFPGTGRFQHLNLLGERERLANKTTIRLTGSEVGALHIGRVTAYFSQYRLRVPVNNLDGHTDNTASFSTFDDLHVLPVRPCSLDGRGTSDARVRRDLSPGFDHLFAIRPFTIRCQGRRSIRMTSFFQLFEEFSRHFIFVLANGAPNPQTSVTVDQGATPERASILLFGVPPFSPLWNTKVHKASIWARLR